MPVEKRKYIRQEAIMKIQGYKNEPDVVPHPSQTVKPGPGRQLDAINGIVIGNGKQTPSSHKKTMPKKVEPTPVASTSKNPVPVEDSDYNQERFSRRKRARRVIYSEDEDEPILPIPSLTSINKEESLVLPPNTHTQYSSAAPQVTWTNGLTTVLPWIDDPKNPGKNILHDDQEHVKKVALDAKDFTKSSDFVTLDFNSYKLDLSLSQAVIKELSFGRVVVLKNYPVLSELPKIFDSRYLDREMKLNAARGVCVQDAVVRTKSWTLPFCKTNVEKFCEATHRPDKVQALLDFPLPDGNVPGFIAHMDHGYQNWTRFNAIPNYRSLLPVDSIKTRSWGLIHHAMFHTYPHHDPEGHATFVQILSGSKLWVILRPRVKPNTRLELYEKQVKFGEGFDVYNEDWQGWVITGRPGDIIIQPPNAWHEVYTPEASVVRGGYFFPIETMHLTEQSRQFDQWLPWGLTNKYHFTAQVALARIILVLVDEPQGSYPRKALTALCQMIVNPAHYIPHYIDMLHQIHLLEDARDAALQFMEAQDAGEDIYLERMPREMRTYVLGGNEILAPQIAMWAIKSYGFDLTSCLPSPTPVEEIPELESMENKADFIFDGNAESPGDSIRLGEYLPRWRKKRH